MRTSKAQDKSAFRWRRNARLRRVDETQRVQAPDSKRRLSLFRPNRHPLTQRQYMLVVDAVGTSGFRNSLYCF
jgi:hypothetical protein